MIIIELIYNLFALLALSVVSNFIDQKFDRRTLTGQIFQGFLFGIIGIIGMMHPYTYSEGIFFDGRSIVISLASLIFGPATGFISAALTSTYRIYVGGAGVIMGTFVILFAFLWGYFFHIRYKYKKLELNNINLFVFGMLVSATMALLIILLPPIHLTNVLFKVAPTVIIFYPIITLLIGKIILNHLSNIDTLQALKESEESIRTTLYSIGDAVITTDKIGNILRMNLVAEELTGWSEIEAIGKPVEEIFVIINENTRQPSQNPVKSVLETGRISHISNHIVLVNKFGKEFPILDSAAPVKRNNETIGVVLVFRDQTAERKKQKQLEEREQFQSFLISNLPGFVYRCAFDKNWTMLYISEGCKELTGYSPQEFINGNPVFNDIIHPDYQELLFNIWEDALRKKEVFEYEYPIITKSENVKWVWERGSGIFSSSGELLYLEGFITDITEKKLYQLQIEESEKKLRTVTNLISDYLFSSKIEKDGTSKKNWIFGAFEEITGYTIEEYTSIGGWRACLHPDDVEIDNQAHQKLLNNQEIVCELRTIHKSGKIVWVKIYAHPIWDDNENRVTEIIGAVQDITNTKKSELFSKIQVIISEAIIKYKSEIELYDIILRELSQIIDIKNFFVAYFNKENGLLQSILEADEKDNIPVWRAKGSLTGYLLEQKKTLCLKRQELEKLILENKINLIGTLPEQWLGVPVTIGDDAVAAVVIQDYNNPNVFDNYIILLMEHIGNLLSIFLERKKREELLFESEERFRNLFENQDAILLLLDAESGMVMDANKSAQNFYKYSINELKEKTIFDIDIASPELIKKAMINIYKGIQSKFEAKHKLSDGQIRNVEIYTSLITIKKHKFFYSIVIDITEQKKAEKQLQLLKTAVIQNPAMIVITNTKGEVEFVNPKFTECTQFTLEEAKGKSTRILKSGFHSDEFYKEMWSKIKQGEDWNGELLNKKKDGSLFWADVRISPIIDRYGKITHYVQLLEDITQRKKILETLIKSEEEFRSVWENSIDAMRLVNEEGIVVNVNQAYCDLFKMNRKDLIDKPLNTAYVIEDRAQALDLFIQRFRLRSIRKKFEQELNLYDGSWIWVEFTNSFIEIKNSPALLLSILRDITSYKKLIKETIEAKEKAEEMNKVKSFFFANMSHELRTPLVGILGFADILKDELEDNPDLAKMAELICKSGQRLHETLNHILNLSKLEAGKIEIKLVEEDIVPHLKNSFLLFEQSARNKGLNYKLELPEKKVICRIDKNLIQNIFNNLINNAIKFTNEGSVTVKLDSYGYIARIQIIDTGIGISEENHSVIWEEFRQVSEGLNRNFEGTGLGLTIVKKFTAVMGGKVSLESKVGKGSNFILEFPLVDKKLEKQINGVSNSTKNNSEIIKAKTSYEILYVEDDQSSVDLVSLMLKNNYYCDVARTPEEALNKVKQNYYKAILMDINLKNGIDGVKLTSLIRQIDGYKNIPIAAITAYALEKDKENFLSQGLTHYLAKPFSKTELINLLKNMLDDSAS